MAIGEVSEVTNDRVRGLYYLDSGLYGTPAYGAVYLYDTPQPTVIETSTGRNHALLLEALEALGIEKDELRNIILTHVHLDHAGGAGLLAADCPDAEVFVHELGAPFMTEPDRLVAGVKRVVGDLWDFHVEPVPIPADRITQLSGGERIDLGDRRLEVMHVPGHATHQVALYDGRSDALFTADEAGMWLPEHDLLTVTTPPTTFDFEQNLRNLQQLASVEATTLLYTHFGPRPIDGALDDYRDRLTDWVAGIKAKRETVDDETVIDHFVASADLSVALGVPAGTEPTRMFIRGVLDYLDRAAE